MFLTFKWEYHSEYGVLFFTLCKLQKGIGMLLANLTELYFGAQAHQIYPVLIFLQYLINEPMTQKRQEIQ